MANALPNLIELIYSGFIEFVHGNGVEHFPRTPVAGPSFFKLCVDGGQTKHLVKSADPFTMCKGLPKFSLNLSASV